MKKKVDGPWLLFTQILGAKSKKKLGKTIFRGKIEKKKNDWLGAKLEKKLVA